MELGDIIRTIRKEKGLTLEELALRVGSDAGNLSRVERGKQRYTPELLQALAEALQTPVSYMFVRAEQKRAPYEVKDKRSEATAQPVENDVFPLLRKSVSSLDEDNQKLVLEFARMLSRQSKAAKPNGD